MLLSDHSIRELCQSASPLISPFLNESISRLDVDNGVRRVTEKVCSFGLSSFGYDLRLGNHFKVLKRAHEVSGARIINPNNFDQDLYRDIEVADGGTFVLPPHGCALGVSKERMALPRNVTGIAMQKSTIARSMMEVTVTPLEAGWEGFLTYEFHNKTDFPIHLLVGQGIAQILFIKGDRDCETSYADRDGKYQNQEARAVAPRSKPTNADQSGRGVSSPVTWADTLGTDVVVGVETIFDEVINTSSKSKAMLQQTLKPLFGTPAGDIDTMVLEAFDKIDEEQLTFIASGLYIQLPSSENFTAWCGLLGETVAAFAKGENVDLETQAHVLTLMQVVKHAKGMAKARAEGTRYRLESPIDTTYFTQVYAIPKRHAKGLPTEDTKELAKQVIAKLTEGMDMRFDGAVDSYYVVLLNCFKAAFTDGVFLAIIAKYGMGHKDGVITRGDDSTHVSTISRELSDLARGRHEGDLQPLTELFVQLYFKFSNILSAVNVRATTTEDLNGYVAVEEPKVEAKEEPLATLLSIDQRSPSAAAGFFKGMAKGNVIYHRSHLGKTYRGLVGEHEYVIEETWDGVREPAPADVVAAARTGNLVEALIDPASPRQFPDLATENDRKPTEQIIAAHVYRVLKSSTAAAFVGSRNCKVLVVESWSESKPKGCKDFGLCAEGQVIPVGYLITALVHELYNSIVSQDVISTTFRELVKFALFDREFPQTFN